jgi:hypothetical protein
VPRVTFGRISRRPVNDEPFEVRPFVEDMTVLADSHETHARYMGLEWVAADLRIDASHDFLTGVLGFMEEESLTTFDADSFSWIKGERREEVGATARTMVPFAVDLREERRWVGFVTTSRIRATTFRQAFAVILNAAVARLGFFPSEWDIDPIASAETVREWIREHPDVAAMTRIVKYPNPARDFDAERQEMRELAARSKTERFVPQRNGRLNLERSELFDQFLQEAELGYVEIRLTSREGHQQEAKFSTAKDADHVVIDSYGDDLAIGMERVQDAVRRFSQRRAGETERHAELAWDDEE